MHSSVGILLIQKGKYLLQFRDNNPLISEPNTYSIWGGALNEHETPEDGAVRELREETGLVVATNRLLKIDKYNILHDTLALKGVVVITHVFALKLNPDEVAKALEGKKVMAVSPGNVEMPMINGVTKMVIRDYEAQT